MKEETLKVLKMVEEGKLSSEKASELLAAMDVNEKAITTSESYNKKVLRIKVDSVDGDKVNVNLPVSVITTIVKATGKLPVNINGDSSIDAEQLTQTVISALENEVAGEIVDIKSADGDIIKIVIE